MKKSDLQRVIDEVVEECGNDVSLCVRGDTVLVVAEQTDVSRAGIESRHSDVPRTLEAKIALRGRLLKAKAVLKNRLLAEFPERKFYHAKSGRDAMWCSGYWYLGVFRRTEIVCGIRIGLTDSERARYLAVGICFD